MCHTWFPPGAKSPYVSRPAPIKSPLEERALCPSGIRSEGIIPQLHIDGIADKVCISMLLKSSCLEKSLMLRGLSSASFLASDSLYQRFWIIPSLTFNESLQSFPLLPGAHQPTPCVILQISF